MKRQAPVPNTSKLMRLLLASYPMLLQVYSGSFCHNEIQMLPEGASFSQSATNGRYALFPTGL